MVHKSSKRLEMICSTIIMTILIVPLSFILTTISATNVTGPTAYSYDDMITAWDKQGYLRFVSTTMSNDSSLFGGENATMTQIPESARGHAIPEEGYLVEEIRDNLYWVTDTDYDTMFLVTDEGVVAIDAAIATSLESIFL